jgi:hypothetical protein
MEYLKIYTDINSLLHLQKNTTHMTSFTIIGDGGLISSSQPMGVQEN